MSITSLPVKAPEQEFLFRTTSPETRRAYGRVVAQFRQFINKDLREVTHGDVRRWRDELLKRCKPATVAQRLAIIRSLYGYLRLGGYIGNNPADVRLVPPPLVSDESKGRALTPQEVRYLLAGPDRTTVSGARDYALMKCLVRLALRRAELSRLRLSDLRRSQGRWVLQIKVKGGREAIIPLPEDVKTAIDHYLKLDAGRRQLLKSDSPDSFLFQPIVNYRTLEYDRGLDGSMIYRIVQRWASYANLGKVHPHVFRATFVTEAFKRKLSPRQIMDATRHRSVTSVLRYDRSRENLEHNAINHMDFEGE